MMLQCNPPFKFSAYAPVSMYLHDINWGARDAWSTAPQLMLCTLYLICLPMNPFHHQATL